jgi:hypothetical protein
MNRFVDLAADKNAADFQQQLEHILGEKAGLALDARKAVIAQNLFDAIPPLTQEEVEQIDELSKKTLGSYVKKASQSVQGHTVTAITGHHKGDHNQFGKHAVLASKRLRGIGKAADKLTK